MKMEGERRHKCRYRFLWDNRRKGGQRYSRYGNESSILKVLRVDGVQSRNRATKYELLAPSCPSTHISRDADTGGNKPAPLQIVHPGKQTGEQEASRVSDKVYWLSINRALCDPQSPKRTERHSASVVKLPVPLAWLRMIQDEIRQKIKLRPWIISRLMCDSNIAASKTNRSMAQNVQNSSSSTSLKEVATTVASSTSPGTAANTVALVVVLWCSLSNIVPPLRPSAAINLLEKAIQEAMDIYDAHKGILRDRESLQADLNRSARLELAALEFKEKYIQDSLNVSWTALPSLPKYLSREKYAWATARAHCREVDALKSKLMLAIIKAKKGPLQTSLGEQGTTNDQKENQGTKLTIDASIV
ncbi:hypothetical protein ARMSODRAFT_975552 [Armillaria solidipes]|uniref:Uncharacterized protein n=1 Tax=Armillaria solidipes TaxID=1076256 RepID=A0A2H3BI85_9AGAR|nr:hypothetical protein ARMSODRAFT_975552 [Armillaria solidipes]